MSRQTLLCVVQKNSGEGQGKKDTRPPSQKLLEQLGLIRQTAAGVYSLLPPALRVLEKVHSIVDEELGAAGAQKLLLPALSPAELWQQSGRWQAASSELFRLQDRREHDFCLSPTHEEVITDVVAHTVSSHRQLPLMLYQIGLKWRDEARPRHGLMRAREFWMKDLYSFDEDEAAAKRTYATIMAAYRRIFARLCLPIAEAEADAGAIGDGYSQEVHVLSSIGDDVLLSCPSCRYTANTEKAVFRSDSVQGISLAEFSSPEDFLRAMESSGAGKVEMVGLHCQAKPPRVDTKIYAVIPRERQLNEVALGRLVSSSFLGGTISQVSSTTVEEVMEDRKIELFFVVDNSMVAKGQTEISSRPEWAVTGAIVEATAGDRCPADGCDGTLVSQRGMEVGHAFYLGTKYSSKFNAGIGFGKDRRDLEMGCYGLGTSRIISAAVEHYHDDKGLKWPPSIAPYKACIVPKGRMEEAIVSAALEDISSSTPDHMDIVVDDRKELSMGKKLSEAERLGYPLVLILSHSKPSEERAGREGSVALEVRPRAGLLRDGHGLPEFVSPKDVSGLLTQLLDAPLQGGNVP